MMLPLLCIECLQQTNTFHRERYMSKLTYNLVVLVSNDNDVYLDLHSMEAAPD